MRPTAKGKTDAEENRLCGSRVRHKPGKLQGLMGLCRVLGKKRLINMGSA